MMRKNIFIAVLTLFIILFGFVSCNKDTVEADNHFIGVWTSSFKTKYQNLPIELDTKINLKSDNSFTYDVAVTGGLLPGLNGTGTYSYTETNLIIKTDESNDFFEGGTFNYKFSNNYRAVELSQEGDDKKVVFTKQ